MLQLQLVRPTQRAFAAAKKVEKFLDQGRASTKVPPPSAGWSFRLGGAEAALVIGWSAK